MYFVVLILIMVELKVIVFLVQAHFYLLMFLKLGETKLDYSFIVVFFHFCRTCTVYEVTLATF